MLTFGMLLFGGRLQYVYLMIPTRLWLVDKGNFYMISMVNTTEGREGRH